MSQRDNITETLISICQRLYAKSFVSATDGNVSARCEDNTFLTTRTGINKGMITAEDLIEVDTNGNVISGRYSPSTELAMHLYIYLQRPDVNAVVHAHPPYATGFATARQPLTGCIFPEVIVGLGAIPLADYATPSTIEVVKAITPYVKNTDAILLANHGVVTYGKDLTDAYFKMEKVEHAAHITFVARLLGGEKLLSAQDIEKLKAISEESYRKDFSGKLACETCDDISMPDSEEEIKLFIRTLIK